MAYNLHKKRGKNPLVNVPLFNDFGGGSPTYNVPLFNDFGGGSPSTIIYYF